MPFRVVVVGTGFGRYAAAPSYEKLGCAVEVVSSRDPVAVRAAVEEPCDLVSVHSPPFQHLDHVRMAVRCGRNVLCDKPFGRNAAEASEMLEIASDVGVLHFLNYQFRHDPARIKLKALLEGGAIGRPVHATWTSFSSSGRRLRHQWLFEAGKGGWIGAFGSHMVDTLRWLFGEVAVVDARVRVDVKQRRDADKTSDRLRESTAEDAFTALFRTANSVTATLDTGWAMAVDRPSSLIVFGEEGALALAGPDLTLLRTDREDERFAYAAAPGSSPQGALDLWLGEVVAAIGGDRRLGPDFTDGLACAVALDAMRASAGLAA